MLFYGYLENIKVVPKSFTKIVISGKERYKNIPDSVFINNLYPKEDMIDVVDGKVIKQYYYEMLSKKKVLSFIVLIMMNLNTGGNIILLTSEKDDKCKFIKKLCNFISERYDYPIYKFEGLDKINLQMKKDSIMDEYTRSLIDEDVEKCYEYITDSISIFESTILEDDENV